jgi:hypothetical protein
VLIRDRTHRAHERGARARGGRLSDERRRRLLRRALPLTLAALLAFFAGASAGSGAEVAAVERFMDAWQRGELSAMHSELTPEAAALYPLPRFVALYERADREATLTGIELEDIEHVESASGEERADVAVAAETAAFGAAGGTLTFPLVDGRLEWAPHLVFPGLASGERLEARLEIPERAPILASGGDPLAEGPAAARSAPAGTASSVPGTLEPVEGERAEEVATRGFPHDMPVGTSGLELAFDERLTGRAGGRLLAVPARAAEDGADVGATEPEVLAVGEPVPGMPLETTVDAGLQDAAVDALAGRSGGIAVLDAEDGSVRALAGAAIDVPQPPGSSFKVVTAAAGLESGAVATEDEFPSRVSTRFDGRRILNAEPPCGGSFAEGFETSCNTVFAAVGVEVGGPTLVEFAERFGFNSPPTLFAADVAAAAHAPSSTVPTTFDSDLALARTAIGEGDVLATPLAMASVAQTIAAGGVRSPTPVVVEPELRADAEPVRATSEETADTIRELMVRVVSTGTARDAGFVPGAVAGKTGTAALDPEPLDAAGLTGLTSAAPEGALNAWFIALAPAEDPQLAVAVVIFNAGDSGGEIAAPAAREVLAAGLE